MNRGGLPAVYPSEDYAGELASYANLYLREEIVAEALVRKVDAFARFLDVIALSNGDELYYQGISNDAGVPVRTVQSFVQILEDTLLGFTVSAFGVTKRRRAITRPRFFSFDVGFTGALARRGEIRERSELFGRAFAVEVLPERAVAGRAFHGVACTTGTCIASRRTTLATTRERTATAVNPEPVPILGTPRPLNVPPPRATAAS